MRRRGRHFARYASAVSLIIAPATPIAAQPAAMASQSSPRFCDHGNVSIESEPAAHALLASGEEQVLAHFSVVLETDSTELREAVQFWADQEALMFPNGSVWSFPVVAFFEGETNGKISRLCSRYEVPSNRTFEVRAPDIDGYEVVDMAVVGPTHAVALYVSRNGRSSLIVAFDPRSEFGGLRPVAILDHPAAFLRVRPAIDASLWTFDIFSHADSGRKVRWRRFSWEH